MKKHNKAVLLILSLVLMLSLSFAVSAEDEQSGANDCTYEKTIKITY